jgi:hypothetical protein
MGRMRVYDSSHVSNRSASVVVTVSIKATPSSVKSLTKYVFDINELQVVSRNKPMVQQVHEPQCESLSPRSR